MKLSKILTLSVVLAVGYVITMGSSSVGAVSGNGYFTGRSINVNPISVRNNDVLSGSSLVGGVRQGFAVPGNLSTKQQVYDWLRNRYASSAANSRDQIGVTFIVKTMIGVSAGTSGSPVSKTLSNADWAELNRRLVQNPNISVRYVTADPNGYGNGRISFYGGGGSGNNGGETFFTTYATGSVPLLIIEDTARNTRYVLERYCANPVGNLSLQPFMPPWDVTGTSSRTVNNVSTGTAAPNQVIRWTHVLTLNGGINTTAILSNTGITGFSNGWNAANHGPETAAVGSPVGTIRSIPLSAADRTVYTVTQNDVGNDLCQRLQWAPTSSTVGTTSTTNYACVNVPYNYNLLPSISIDTSRNGGSIEPNTPVGVDKIVNNQGPTKSRDTEWRMSQLVVRAGGSISNTGGGENINDPCVFWSGSTSCNDSDRGTGRVINPGRLSLGSTEQLVGDLDAGDKICWGLSVRAYSHNSPAGQWRHSSLVCLTVAKTPKIQFWGADARSSGQVTTARTQVGLQMYGSWAEYGIMSQSAVNSASGAMLSSGADGRPTTDDQGLNPLTFANSGGVYGSYGVVPPTNLTASFTDTSTGSLISGTVDLSSLDSGEYRATGNMRLSGNVSSGKRIIIKTTGAVEITGNITYDNGPYSSLSAVPQLVISANSIAISESVNEVNGWMIANRASGSYVSTCGTVASAATWTNGLSSTVCNQPLRVNGVIVTNHLYLRRTFGADRASRHIPAETLNLRPDVYLWTSSESGNSGAISTMKIRELPPRY